MMASRWRTCGRGVSFWLFTMPICGIERDWFVDGMDGCYGLRGGEDLR